MTLQQVNRAGSRIIPTALETWKSWEFEMVTKLRMGKWKSVKNDNKIKFIDIKFDRMKSVYFQLWTKEFDKEWFRKKVKISTNSFVWYAVWFVLIHCDLLSSLSPSGIRKRIHEIIRGSARKQSINLEVPTQQFFLHSSPDSSDNEGDVRISVPSKRSGSPRRTVARSRSQQSSKSGSKSPSPCGEMNVVAPWEDAPVF